MSKRWNRKDLDLDRALEEGLCRSARPACDDAQAREKFKLLLRICRTALNITDRDRDILQSILDHPTQAAAAREMMPESAGYRCYLSRRLKKLEQIAQNFLLENSIFDGDLAERQELASVEVNKK